MVLVPDGSTTLFSENHTDLRTKPQAAAGMWHQRAVPPRPDVPRRILFPAKRSGARAIRVQERLTAAPSRATAGRGWSPAIGGGLAARRAAAPASAFRAGLRLARRSGACRYAMRS